MKKDFVKYIKKLRLVKGRDYILIVDQTFLPMKEISKLNDALRDMGYKSLAVAIPGGKGIKIIEKEKE